MQDINISDNFSSCVRGKSDRKQSVIAFAARLYREKEVVVHLAALFVRMRGALSAKHSQVYRSSASSKHSRCAPAQHLHQLSSAAKYTAV